MRADNDAEPADRDRPDLRVCFSDLIPYIGSVRLAVGMENANLNAGCVDLGKIVQYTGEDGFERGLSAADFLRDVKRTAIRHIEHGLDLKHSANQRGSVRYAAAGFQILKIVDGKTVRDPEFVFFAPGNDFVEPHAGFHALHHVGNEKPESAGMQRVSMM